MKLKYTIVLSLFVIFHLSINCYATSMSDIDFSSMTYSELQILMEAINSEIDRNHSLSDDQINIVESVVRAKCEENMGKENITWDSGSCSYTREWNLYILDSMIRLNTNGSENNIIITANVLLDGQVAELIYLSIDDKVVVDSRENIDDNKVRKALKIEYEVSDNNEPIVDEVSIANKWDQNDTVRSVQQLLISLGYMDGTADGQFGNVTENAIKKYQTDNGLDSTGKITHSLYDSLKISERKLIK